MQEERGNNISVMLPTTIRGRPPIPPTGRDFNPPTPQLGGLKFSKLRRQVPQMGDLGGGL